MSQDNDDRKPTRPIRIRRIRTTAPYPLQRLSLGTPQGTSELKGRKTLQEFAVKGSSVLTGSIETTSSGDDPGLQQKTSASVIVQTSPAYRRRPVILMPVVPLDLPPDHLDEAKRSADEPLGTQPSVVQKQRTAPFSSPELLVAPVEVCLPLPREQLDMSQFELTSKKENQIWSFLKSIFLLFTWPFRWLFRRYN
jgi:hypothetical protein